MANRHLSRSIVLQTLFESDFNKTPKKNILSLFSQNVEEFAPGIDDEDFMKTLLNGVISKQKELDNVIERAAPDWPIDKISPVDRNILRIGLYELLFGDREEVPPKVAINESIELAKSFGGLTSGKFVNGVLGAVYKELGEPGKDQQSKKIKNKDLPDDQVPVEHLAGAVVFARDKDDIFIALVHDVFGHWTLTKGKIGDAPEIATETPEEGLKREIKEEIGLDVKVGPKLGQNSYIAYDPEKGKIKKSVDYFLVESPFEDLKLESTGGLDDAQWFKLRNIVDLNFYDDILPIVTKAINILIASKK